MSEKSEKKAINSLNILNGVIIMIISSFIFFFPDSGLIFLIYIFTVIILLSGISRVYSSINNDNLSNAGKATKFISGFFLIILSLVVFFITLDNPTFSTDLLIIFLTIGLLVIGFARVATGILNDKYIKWFRVFLLIIGIVTIIPNLILIIVTDLNTTLVVYIIGITLFINGFTRFLYGLTGTEKFRRK